MHFFTPILDYFAQNRLEWLGFVLTLIGIWLNVRQSIWGWVVGIGGIICYAVIFFQIQLYGDFSLQLYFFLTSLYGFWAWYRKPDQAQTLAVSTLTAQERRILALLVFVGTLLVGAMLSYVNPSFAYSDAFTTVLSVIAQVLLARKKLENWVLWIIANLVYIVMYYYKGVYLTCFLYTLLLFLAMQGFWEWKKKIEK